MIKDLSELRKLLRLCRAQGVTEIELGDVKIKLGDLPQAQAEVNAVEDSQYPDGELTAEQLMFYSAGGGDDPTRHAQ